MEEIKSEITAGESPLGGGLLGKCGREKYWSELDESAELILEHWYNPPIERLIPRRQRGFVLVELGRFVQWLWKTWRKP
ncbi:MAG: hypothetical protein U1E51_07085 [Candidatus Binatia bacterium]|nr:hypothetical protein [Candidatus Binatia bacterium]